MTEPLTEHWYWEVVATCPCDQEELFSYYLFEENVSGIEEIKRTERSLSIKIFFPSQTSHPENSILSIKRILGIAGKGIELISVVKKPFENWQSNWKAFFKPLPIGDSFIVRPPWEEPTPDKNEIVIYPGFGFGTGYHESTNLALRLLEWLNKSHEFDTVIDVGAGSGILTIAALLLKANKVTAIDIEEETPEEIRLNLVHSGLDHQKCETKVCGPDQLEYRAGLVLANIEDFILIKLAKDLTRLTLFSGYLLLSGILTERKTELLKAFDDDFNLVVEMEMKEWTGMILQKNRDPDFKKT